MLKKSSDFKKLLIMTISIIYDAQIVPGAVLSPLVCVTIPIVGNTALPDFPDEETKAGWVWVFAKGWTACNRHGRDVLRTRPGALHLHSPTFSAPLLACLLGISTRCSPSAVSFPSRFKHCFSLMSLPEHPVSRFNMGSSGGGRSQKASLTYWK